MRLRPSLGISAASLWLPDTTEDVTAAIERGAVDAEDAERLGIKALTVSDLAPPQMGVEAASRALAAAGWPARSIDLVVHAYTYYQGHDFWSPAHYVASQIGAGHAEAFGIAQMCAGGATGLAVAAARLVADGHVRRALVTTADRFAEPGFHRWTSDYGVAYGDGATAVLLSGSTAAAPARLRSVATATASALERTHRGSDPFTAAARQARTAVDVRRTMKAYLDANGIDTLLSLTDRNVRAVLSAACADAAVDPASRRLRYVVLPRIGVATIERSYLPAICSVTSAQQLLFGENSGHLGAGDVAAGIAELLDLGLLRCGEFAAILGVGAGYTWVCAIIEAA